MRVVDAHEHGVGFRELGQEGQQRDPDGQRVRRLGVVRERAVEGIGLGVGEVRELADRGPEQFGEAGERELGLGLDTLRLEQRSCRPPARARVAEQRGLADAGFAPQDQDPAAASARGRQQQIDAVALGCTTHEHEGERRPRRVRVAVKTW